MSSSLTSEELGERWKKPPLWVTREARAGNIPGAWKLGREWRFLESEIEAYETSRSANSFFALTPRSRARQKQLR